MQGLAAALAGAVLALLPFSSPQHTHGEREGVGERREEREEETNPKEGFGFSIPPVYVSQKSR